MLLHLVAMNTQTVMISTVVTVQWNEYGIDANNIMKGTDGKENKPGLFSITR